jgi:hypothetical protein
VNDLIIALIIFIVLYYGFKNGRTPKTYFTNCKLTRYTRIIMRHERIHIKLKDIMCFYIDAIIHIDIIDLNSLTVFCCNIPDFVCITR